jgi:hypothetical protein
MQGGRHAPQVTKGDYWSKAEAGPTAQASEVLPGHLYPGASSSLSYTTLGVPCMDFCLAQPMVPARGRSLHAVQEDSCEATDRTTGTRPKCHSAPESKPSWDIQAPQLFSGTKFKALL